MARRRYQEPKPKKQGRWWYLLYWQDEFVNGKRVRKRKRVKLAPAEMKEREVRKIAAEHLRPLNQALLTSGSATTFGTYVDQIYQPTIMPLLASSTQDRYARVLKNHLKPAFGDAPLRDVTLLSMQRYFAGLGRSDLSHESIDKLRDVLASVLRSSWLPGQESNRGSAASAPATQSAKFHSRRQAESITLHQCRR